MRDLASKMAELKFEAPLAQFEETDDWGSTEFQNNTTAHLKNENEINNINLNKKNKELSDVLMKDFGEDVLLDNSNVEILLKKSDGSVADNFTETFSGSLEDLVNTFDEKITKCFGNYEESVEKLAPVQVRTQEEIMNECQWVQFSICYVLVLTRTTTPIKSPKLPHGKQDKLLNNMDKNLLFCKI